MLDQQFCLFLRGSPLPRVPTCEKEGGNYSSSAFASQKNVVIRIARAIRGKGTGGAAVMEVCLFSFLSALCFVGSKKGRFYSPQEHNVVVVVVYCLLPDAQRSCPVVRRCERRAAGEAQRGIVKRRRKKLRNSCYDTCDGKAQAREMMRDTLIFYLSTPGQLFVSVGIMMKPTIQWGFIPFTFLSAVIIHKYITTKEKRGKKTYADMSQQRGGAGICLYLLHMPRSSASPTPSSSSR
eukprot:gene10347-7240_t